jgi:N-acetylglucosaminyl-diphospho-decaprenol L-rhamnosyltransferase
MKQPQRTLNVLLVSYNTRHLLDECLAALAQALQAAPQSRIIIIDNASRDDSAAHLREHHPEVELMCSPRNIGFGRANNLALPGFDGEFLLLLNTDAFVAPESIQVALAHMAQHPRCGVLGVRLVGRDGSLQPSCRYFPTPLNQFAQRVGAYRWPLARLWGRPVDDMSWDHASERNCDWVPGCFYLVRREVLEQVGLFDPRFFLYFEEVDHCRRVQAAGWTIDYCPHTQVVHIGGESARSDGPINRSSRQVEALQVESALLYTRKHHGLSGLVQHMLFDGLGAAITALKALLRRRSWAEISQAPQLHLLGWRLLWRTRLGQQATL